MFVSTLDRFVRKSFSPTMSRARNRMHTVAAGAALAAIAGVSAPMAAQAMGPANDVSTTVPASAVAAITAPADKGHGADKPGRHKGAKPGAPSWKQMHPRGIHAEQTGFTPSKEQLRNARAIIETGEKMGLPPRAYVIAVATSLQESTLHNYGNLGANNDHDSLGLFQQRPSSGWGSPDELKDPKYAAKAFYRSLVKVDGWKRMPLTKAAQSVQVSAFPDHYAKWEKMAGKLVKGHYGVGPYAKKFDKI